MSDEIRALKQELDGLKAWCDREITTTRELLLPEIQRANAMTEQMIAEGHEEAERNRAERAQKERETKRDYFAAQALPAVIAAYAIANSNNDRPQVGADHLPRNCAAHAYRIADAMLAARAEGSR
jgi:hypothetical protein